MACRQSRSTSPTSIRSQNPLDLLFGVSDLKSLCYFGLGFFMFVALNVVK
jgi:hypothetical protein